jgi:beta-N-acetylhexosaminidase
MRAALIAGLSGEVLTADEQAYLRDVRPAGVILFARNCSSPEQIRKLVDAACSAISSGGVLVLIDQEGGRVRRLRPPQWRELPAAAAFARLRDEDRRQGERAAWLAARLTAQDLRSLGINTNCTPVLDLKVEGAHDIIGDRAYGSTPAEIAGLARAVAEGHLAGGVVPVIKHIPGHGRALADSHFELPLVDTSRAELSATDFAPFRALAEMPAAMTAHVVYSAIDPDLPGSASARVTAEVIRGEIGFDGLLMSDDLGMKALSGSFGERARAVIAADSDIALHCSGNFEEMYAVAAGVPPLAGRALDRFEACLAITRRIEPFDVAEAEAALAAVIGQGGAVIS